MNVKWAAIITIIFILSISFLNMPNNISPNASAQEGQTPTVVDEPASHLGPVPGQLASNDDQVSPAQGGVVSSNMFQGFEGAWPDPAGGWNRQDESSNDGGEYLFADRQSQSGCFARSGAWHGWSVGAGVNGSLLNCATSVYPNNASTAAWYGPFDLTNAASSVLTFYYRGYGEDAVDSNGNPFDYLFVAAYPEGSATACGRAIFRSQQQDGPSSYTSATLNLNTFSCSGFPSTLLGQSRVYILFRFASDNSIQGGPGYFVDDITLTTFQAPTVTPSRTHTSTRTHTPSITPTSSQTHTPSNTPTNTATGEPTNTPTVTVTPTDTQPVTSEGKNFLPGIVKEDSSIVQPPTVTPTPTTPPPTPIPSDCGDVEPNSTRGLAKPLLVTGQFCRGSLEGEGDGGDDYYAVQLEAGQVIEVSLVGVPPGANFDIFLYDPANRRILEAESINPDQNDEFYTYTVPNKGRYLVDVFGRTVSRSAPNSYLLKVVVR